MSNIWTVNSGLMEDGTQGELSDISDYRSTERYLVSCIYCSNLPWLCTCTDLVSEEECLTPPPVILTASQYEQVVRKREMAQRIANRLVKAEAAKRDRYQRRKRFEGARERRWNEDEARARAAITLQKMRASRGDSFANPMIISSSDEEEPTPPTEEYNGRPALSDFRGTSAAEQHRNRAKFSAQTMSFIEDEAEQRY